MTPIPEPDIRAELDRILASKGFATAGRISKLLRYVVDKTLAGETDQLKEYSVGIEVFERDDKYDPRLDSIVRVEAGRLRTKLDEYYNGEGAASPIRINLPKGGYSAQFSAAARENSGESGRNPAEAAEGREGGRREDLGRRFHSRPFCSSRSGRWCSGLAAAIAAHDLISGRPRRCCRSKRT